MEEEFEDERHHPHPVSFVVVAVMAVLSLAILYNSLLAQHAPRHIVGEFDRDDWAIPSSGTTHVTVNATSPESGVVTLRYDAQIEAVQRELSLAGYYKGPIDGIGSRRTNQAIATYQRDSGLEPTGQLTADLADQIRLSHQMAEAANFTASTDRADMVNNSYKVAESDVRRIERALAQKGYHPGISNGAMSPATIQAIRNFQADHGEEPTGKLTKSLIMALEEARNDNKIREMNIVDLIKRQQ